jgi:hypothetical protein
LAQGVKTETDGFHHRREGNTFPGESQFARNGRLGRAE